MKPPRAVLGGLLGDALSASRRGRLFHFIQGPHSPAIALFDYQRTLSNTEGDWYGEHAGKWLVAASRAAEREGDAALTQQVHAVADYLVAQQQPDGYLGTYAVTHRFTTKQPPKPLSWDGAPSVRTWDIWIHSYLILGLLEAYRVWGVDRWLAAACRIADLCFETLSLRHIDITDLGNHHGLSATVLMDPACELYFVTREPRYLALAELVLAQADAHLPLALLQQAKAGADPSQIATGKAYQLAWNLVGLAKLQRATNREDLRHAVIVQWQAIADHHLTLGGGPWGGVGHRSREVFNPAGVFSPQAYVETCSTLAWIQLNAELLKATGDARYAEEIERSAYNDLLGALAPNGHDWCYYVFPNGRRVHTTYWRCCKSSGAMALEELPALAYAQSIAESEQALSIHLYGPSRAEFDLAGLASVNLEQRTQYPYRGQVSVFVTPSQPVEFTLRLRCPGWARAASLRVNGGAEQAMQAGQYTALRRIWQAGDRVELELPMPVEVHRRENRNVQESKAPDGSPVRQVVLNDAYFALTRGPLVYATGLVDGFKSQECLRLPDSDQGEWLQTIEDESEPVLRLSPLGRTPIDFKPFFLADGREDGRWRLTWFALATADSPTGEIPC